MKKRYLVTGEKNLKVSLHQTNKNKYSFILVIYEDQAQTKIK